MFVIVMRGRSFSQWVDREIISVPVCHCSTCPNRDASAIRLNGVDHFYRVQRLMLSKGAKGWISDDITRFPKYL